MNFHSPRVDSMHRFVVAALVLALSPSLSRAQAEPSVGERPKQFIIVEIGPTTSLGFGWRASPRTDVSLEGGLRVSDEGDNSSRAFSVRPAIKWYLGSTAGSVAPYLTLGANAEWTRLELGGALAVRREGQNFPTAPAEVITGHEIGTRSSGVRLRMCF